MDKKQSRLRRGKKVRAKIRELGAFRLCVHRTPRHIYAQVISPEGDKTVLSVSTLDKAVAAELKGTGNISAAAAVGKAVASRALAAGVEQVAFDRAGFRYHGRIKALADAAREGGLKF